ncbi:hypothetical protein E2C01_093915 [Portunus trituberculatus]|uniref:Uncharacterized protein n=1 Tax=Portunus trituberculatus TaxID=210409 RepID=A0A5B7JKD6_PORTR|nr:hypothetical protein [Portunus trituberculatus]
MEDKDRLNSSPYPLSLQEEQEQEEEEEEEEEEQEEEEEEVVEGSTLAYKLVGRRRRER